VIARAVRIIKFMISILKKAGLSGLFVLCAAPLASLWPASAAPLVLEVMRATTGFDPGTNRPNITIALTDTSKRAFAELTTDNVGAQMELRIDGKVIVKPVIREPILGGVVFISGVFTTDETTDIARRLSAGSVRIEVEVVK
jgi:preprotein translocase subunit SecD